MFITLLQAVLKAVLGSAADGIVKHLEGLRRDKTNQELGQQEAINKGQQDALQQGQEAKDERLNVRDDTDDELDDSLRPPRRREPHPD